MNTDRSRIVNSLMSIIEDENASFDYKSMIKAAKNCDVSEISLSIFFPNGMRDVIDDLYLMYSDSISESISKECHYEDIGFGSKIEFIMHMTIDYISLNRKFWISVFRFLIKPSNLLLANSLRAMIVDITMQKAGDKSMDFNFYTKRAILSGIYLSVIIYWHISADVDKVKSFATSRISDTKLIGKCKTNIFKLYNNVIDTIRQKCT